MAQNRIIPYGYLMQMCKIEINKVESEIVKAIYIKYSQGESYKKIADELTIKEVRYTKDKTTWNKNMVARILQNSIYVGEDGYPQIIPEELSQKVKSVSKPYTQTESKEIKEIKPLLYCEVCGGKVKRRFKSSTNERWFCENDIEHISHKLKDDDIQEQLVEVIETKLSKHQFIERLSIITSIEIEELERKIEHLLNADQIDVELSRQSIIKLAELRYASLQDTMHMKEEALNKLTSNALDNAEALKEVIEKVLISGYGIKQINIIDGTIFKKG